MSQAMSQEKSTTNDEQQIQHEATDPSSAPDPAPAFTVFSNAQKRWIILLAAFASMFSPMSSFIFYPAITSIAADLGVTVELVNLAITTYMVVSGVIPAILGNAADKFGRRPIFLLAMVLYLAANLGLSFQRTYVGLLVLRMLQSAGSSGTISLGYGVVSDITTPATRGVYVGILLLGPNVAAPIGPIIGGVLSSKLGWKWVFRFLCILGGSCLILVFIALPETCRAIVGNGRVPAKGIYRTYIPNVVEPITNPNAVRDGECEPIPEKKFSFPTPIDCLRLLLERDIAILLLCNGIYYMICCCIQASLSSLFIEVYHYESLEAGLIYIPFGVACLASTALWGKILNHEYGRAAKKMGVAVDKIRQDDSDEFPIETARLQSSLYLVAMCTVGTIAYGWVVEYQVHVAAPLILQTLVGFSSTGLFVALGTLLTDLNPTRSSTAAASANLVRCALAATALAVLQLIIDAIGVGWCFTVFGCLSALCGPLMIWEMRTGRTSRQKRAARNSQQ